MKIKICYSKISRECFDNAFWKGYGMNQENLEEILGNIDISGEAPVLEPDRQYYFMKKARMLVKEKSEDL